MATESPPLGRLTTLTERAFSALCTDATPEAVEALRGRVAQFAAELLLEWLTGDKRFDNQSQQLEYWVSRFYDEFYVGEQPDAARIYARFGLSLPRARYVAGLLRARGATAWRSAARQELRLRLQARQAEAQSLQRQTPEQADVQDYEIGLSAGAADELRVFYDRLVAMAGNGAQPRPPKFKQSFGGHKILAVPALTLLAVLRQLDT